MLRIEPRATTASLPFNSSTCPTAPSPSACLIATQEPTSIIPTIGLAGAGFGSFFFTGLANFSVANSVNVFRIAFVASFSADFSLISRIVCSIFWLASLMSCFASVLAEFNSLFWSSSNNCLRLEYCSLMRSACANWAARLLFLLSQICFSVSVSINSLSKSTWFLPSFFRAFSMICVGRPIFWAISKANELPGFPISKMN